MAKSGWTDEDEKALLALLQKKWHSGNSGSGYAAGSSILTPLESQGAMTDGSKRLREALDDDEFDVISSAAEPLSAQLPVMPIPIFPGIADKVLDQLTADLMPEGMSFRDWSRTKFAFGKFANEGKTYREVYVDEEMAGYCKLSHTQRTLEDTYALLQQTELLAGAINEQDCRAIRTACCCLKSLRIRVEARANVDRTCNYKPTATAHASERTTLPYRGPQHS